MLTNYNVECVMDHTKIGQACEIFFFFLLFLLILLFLYPLLLLLFLLGLGD
jgi:pilus assembly protein TadC